jgi:hypothetical protein
MSDNKDKESSESNDKTIENVLESLKADLLKELVEGNDSKSKMGKAPTKKKLSAKIMDIAEKKGGEAFLGALDKEALRSALLQLENTDDLGHDSKTKMVQAFKDHVKKLTYEKMFLKLSAEVLDQFCEALEFKEEGSKDEKIDALCEEITVNGLRQMFQTMATDFIKDVAKALDLSQNGSRIKIVDRILSEGYPHLKETAKDDKKEKGKKGKREKGDYANAPSVDEIKKGIDFQQLYQYYTEQLKDWLKEKDLKSSGSKKDLCKRIEGYLNGDEKFVKEAQKLKPGERRNKRKRGGRKTKSEDKESEEEEKPAKKQKTK